MAEAYQQGLSKLKGITVPVKTTHTCSHTHIPTHTHPVMKIHHTRGGRQSHTFSTLLKRTQTINILISRLIEYKAKHMKEGKID